MIDFALRPLETWPRPFTEPRRKGDFRASWATTERDLDVELRALKAEDVVLQLALGKAGFRLGSSLTIKTDHPGVILSFASIHGPLSFACDYEPEHARCCARRNCSAWVGEGGYYCDAHLREERRLSDEAISRADARLRELDKPKEARK